VKRQVNLKKRFTKKIEKLKTTKKLKQTTMLILLFK